MAYFKRERTQQAIDRSAKKVSRKKRLKRKEEAFIALDASGNRPTLASKPRQRITKDMYLRELEKIPHASEYTLISDFKLYTPRCIVQYKHNPCGTKFQTTPRDFELGKCLCPKCYKDMSSTTNENA